MKTLTNKEFIKDLTKLISLNTLTSDVETNKKALDFIQSKINKHALIKRIKNGKAECLIASNNKSLKPDICFLAHVDVVAGKSSQFKIKIKNGIAYGRGTSDMKFSIPIGYALLNEIIENKIKLSFAFVVTTDEETGGFEGARYLAEEYGFTPQSLIVPDGGDNFTFISKSKGVCGLRIDSTGIPAHSSRIWKGKNALEPIIKLCNVLLKKYEKNNERESWKTTMNIGKLHGGISSNQVCPQAYAILDFRFPETTTFTAIRDEVIYLANKIDPNLKVSVYSQGMPKSVNLKNPIVKTFIRCCEEKLEKKIQIAGAHGSSDARHFASSKALILMIKPFGGDIHGDNEHVNIDSCIDLYQILRKFLLTVQDNPSLLDWHK